MSLDGPTYDDISNIETKDDSVMTLAALGDEDPVQVALFDKRYNFTPSSYKDIVAEKHDDDKSIVELMNDIEESVCGSNKECLKSIENIIRRSEKFEALNAGQDLINYAGRVLAHYRKYRSISPRLEGRIRKNINDKIKATVAELNERKDSIDAKLFKGTREVIKSVKVDIKELVDNFMNAIRMRTAAKAFGIVVASTNLAPTSTIAAEPVKENSHIISSIIQDGDSLGGRLQYKNKFGVGASALTNGDDKVGGALSVDYSNEDFGVGIYGGKSTKKNIGDQSNLGLRGYKTIGDHISIDAGANYTDFTADQNSGLADAKRMSADLGATVAPNKNWDMNAKVGAVQNIVKGYDKNFNSVAGVGVGVKLGDSWRVSANGELEFGKKGIEERWTFNLTKTFGKEASYIGKSQRSALAAASYNNMNDAGHSNASRFYEGDILKSSIETTGTFTLNAISAQSANDNGGGLPTGFAGLITGAGIQAGAVYSITSNPTLADVTGSDTGLTIDSSTGAMSLDINIDATPSKTYPIIVKVVNPDGSYGTILFNLVVTDNA